MKLKGVPPTDIRALPNYTILESSHYLRIPVTTLKSWVVGRGYAVRVEARRSRPLIRPAQAHPTVLLSFVNLVEAHILHAIRHKYGIVLDKARRALDYVERRYGDKHPLITQEFKTDRLSLFIEKLGELIDASHDGQVVLLRNLFEQHLERVEHDEAGLAERLFPFTRPTHDASQPKMIVIDPKVSFGRPVIVGSGVPTAAIVERYHAGESPEHLAQDYRRSVDEIQEAIRCETGRG